MRIWVLLRPIILIFAAAPCLCWAQKANLTIDQIVARMQQASTAERTGTPGYTVTREYWLSAADAPQPASDVVAQVTFIPPSDKQYVIVKAEGNERGAGIVRKVLDHEAAMAGRWRLHDISRDNYDFALLGHETIAGHDCYVLELSPKREAVELIRGKAWVNAQNFHLIRVAGETVKSPSMWLKKLTVTLNFGQVNGVWLETSTRAVADVRFVGPHVLTSREIDVETDALSARARSPRLQQRSSSHLASEAADWVAH